LSYGYAVGEIISMALTLAHIALLIYMTTMFYACRMVGVIGTETLVYIIVAWVIDGISSCFTLTRICCALAL